MYDQAYECVWVAIGWNVPEIYLVSTSMQNTQSKMENNHLKTCKSDVEASKTVAGEGERDRERRGGTARMYKQMVTLLGNIK